MLNSISTRFVAAAAAGTLLLAACGSDGGSGGSADGAKDLLFDEMMSSLDEGDSDIEGLDRDCVRDAIDEIPDDQAQILADNIDSPDIPDGVDPEIVGTLTSAMFDCVDFGALLEE